MIPLGFLVVRVEGAGVAVPVTFLARILAEAVPSASCSSPVSRKEASLTRPQDSALGESHCFGSSAPAGDMEQRGCKQKVCGSKEE